MTNIALALGLNHVSRDAYDGWDGELSGCHLDADAIAELALQNGWYVDDVLLDSKATGTALDEKMEGYAKALETGDRFLLSYSGHGSSIPDTSGDEDDGRDECWCLYDGQLVDDRIAAMLSRFRAGVRIAVVADCCHAGTSVRDRRSRPIAKLPDPEIGLVQASVLLLAGCSDPQVSMDGQNGGAFTTAMLECLRHLPEGAGWRTLHRKIVQAMPRSQTPRLDLSGIIDPAFVDERPFVT